MAGGQLWDKGSPGQLCMGERRSVPASGGCLQHQGSVCLGVSNWGRVIQGHLLARPAAGGMRLVHMYLYVH